MECIYSSASGAFVLISPSDDSSTHLHLELSPVSFSSLFHIQVWSLVRFDQPQKYKPFVSRCVVQGDLVIGSVRQANVKSWLPATTNTERLELLDDTEHILSIKILDGDHRLKQQSATKVTFPLVWTNSCCSHPLYRESELIDENCSGVKNATQRKLLDELGIPPEDGPIDQFIPFG